MFRLYFHKPLVKKGLTSVVDIENANNSLIHYASLQNTLNIKCNGAGLVELITLTGVVTKSFNIHGNTTIELEGMNKGIYFVRLKNSGRQNIQKIIVSTKL